MYVHCKGYIHPGLGCSVISLLQDLFGYKFLDSGKLETGKARAGVGELQSALPDLIIIFINDGDLGSLGASWTSSGGGGHWSEWRPPSRVALHSGCLRTSWAY